MNIKIFSLGQKGFAVVKALSSLMCVSSITCVIGQDNEVDDDWSFKLREFCILNKIMYEDSNAVSDIDNYDLYLAVGWRWLIKSVPKDKLIIFHDSLLPRYRGFSPLVSALLNREELTGVTAFLASDEYDKGNILMQHQIRLNYPTYISHEILRISIVYADLAVDLVSKFHNRSINMLGVPQDENNATYSLWRSEEDYRINWSDTAENILHFINCIGEPYKGASALLNGKLVRILKANSRPDVAIENRSVGKVIFFDGIFPVVVCGAGLLQLEHVMDSEGVPVLPLEKFRSRFI